MFLKSINLIFFLNDFSARLQYFCKITIVSFKLSYIFRWAGL